MRITHFEIPAKDCEELAKFYSLLLGWEVKKWEGPMEYWLVSTGKESDPGIDGAIFPGESAKAGTGYGLIVDVVDLDALLERVSQLGGSISRERHEVPQVGIIAYILDPSGNEIGLMQSFSKSVNKV